jgi:hypothetical protein
MLQQRTLIVLIAQNWGSSDLVAFGQAQNVSLLFDLVA